MKISINSKWGRGESRGNKTDHILITAEMGDRCVDTNYTIFFALIYTM